MNQKDRQIFEQFAEIVIPEIKSVSKRFAPSVEHTIEETSFGGSFAILASEYISTLIDGRRPTRQGAPAGSPNLQQILFAWIRSKGIVPRPNKNGIIPTLESLSFAMSRSMHEKGDLLFQPPLSGGNNIFDPILTRSRLENLFNTFEENYFFKVESEILKQIQTK